MSTKEYKPMQKYYKFGLYLLVIVLINLVGITLFFRFDLTSGGLYSLSDASKDVVQTLEEPLTINVFFSKNLPAPYNNIELYLHDLLEEYRLYAGDNLSYRFYDVTAQEGDLSEEAEENRKVAQSYGIQPVNVQRIEQDEAKVQRAYMGIALIHGDLVEKIPAVTTTEGLEYKITGAIRKMNNKISALLSLSEKIKVTLVLSSSVFNIAPMVNLKGLDGVKAGMQDMMKKLNTKTYGQLVFEHLDPTMGQGTPEQLAPFERFGLQWPELKTDGTTIPPGKGWVAVGMSHGGKSVEINLLNRSMALTARGFEEQFALVEMKDIETFITENIDNLIDINEDVGYLSSNGTLSLVDNVPPQMRMMQPQSPDALNRFNGLLGREYSVKEVNLENDIPEGIDTLIIAGAKENFNDWQLYQIDQFLMKGKSLAIFLDAFNEIMPQGQQRQFQQPYYIPLNTGLEKLLSHYGVKVKKSYLMDESCYINRDRMGNEMPIYFAPIIKNEKINHDPDFMENIKQLVVMKVSPLEADQETIDKNDLTLHELFGSSDKSWEMSGRITLMPYMIQPPKDDKDRGGRSLAYLLEGEFPSYFADKPVPEKPEATEEGKEGEAKKDDKAAEKKKKALESSAFKKEKGVLAKGKPGKIFLIGSSEMLKDNVLDEEGQSPNAVFLLNTLDYLNNREDIAVMRSKNQRFNPLDETKPFTRTVVKVINIGGLPALFIFFGIMVWLGRIARKKKIQAMFKGGRDA